MISNETKQPLLRIVNKGDKATSYENSGGCLAQPNDARLENGHPPVTPNLFSRVPLPFSGIFVA